MDLVEISKKILSRQSVNISEITNFISEVIYLFKKEYPTSEQLKALTQLAFSGMLDLNIASRKVLQEKNEILVLLLDSNNNIIKRL